MAETRRKLAMEDSPAFSRRPAGCSAVLRADQPDGAALDHPLHTGRRDGGPAHPRLRAVRTGAMRDVSLGAHSRQQGRPGLRHNLRCRIYSYR